MAVQEKLHFSDVNSMKSLKKNVYNTILDAEFHHLLFYSIYESVNCWDAADQENFGGLRYGYDVKWGSVLLSPWI